ncbi:MAG: RNA-binding protein [Candidatus Methylacidiphilales bacterium]|nr:RNA-binding protein [Candidatus Methylacidiphilales bacterium]
MRLSFPNADKATPGSLVSNHIMEEHNRSRGPRGPRRGGPRRGGRYDRGPRGPRSEAPRKKKNPILAFFAKLFGGDKKTAPANGHATGERRPRPDRPDRARTNGHSAAGTDEATSRVSGSTAAALAEANPEVSNEKLYIGNLSYDASESDLFDLFSKVGTVKNVEIVRDKSGRSKGFGFVEMNTIESAKEASAKNHRTDFMGRPLVVAGAKK